MRTFADRIDHAGAPKGLSLCFTFETGRGLVINDKDAGCRLWYLGDDEYAKAHDDAGQGLLPPTWAHVAG